MSKESYRSRFISANPDKGTYYYSSLGVSDANISALRIIAACSDISPRAVMNNILTDHFNRHSADIKAVVDESLSSANLLAT